LYLEKTLYLEKRMLGLNVKDIRKYAYDFLKASPHLKDLSAKRPKFLPRNDTIRL
jgi:hypothetical protein